MGITPSPLIGWNSFLLTQAKTTDFLNFDTLLGNNFGQVCYTESIRDWLDIRDGAFYRPLGSAHMMRLFLESAVTRPVESCCRLSYHIFLPLSIPHEILYAIRKENLRRRDFPWLPSQSKLSLGIVAALRSIADIVRIPYYGTLLTVYAFAATCTYFTTRNDPERQFIGMMEWRVCIARVERKMVWHDREKCYTKMLQPVDFIHRLPRFCDPNSTQDPYWDGLNACWRRKNHQWHTIQAMSPLSRFLWKIPNFFSHSTL